MHIACSGACFPCLWNNSTAVASHISQFPDAIHIEHTQNHHRRNIIQSINPSRCAMYNLSSSEHTTYGTYSKLGNLLPFSSCVGHSACGTVCCNEESHNPPRFVPQKSGICITSRWHCSVGSVALSCSGLLWRDIPYRFTWTWHCTSVYITNLRCSVDLVKHKLGRWNFRLSLIPIRLQFLDGCLRRCCRCYLLSSVLPPDVRSLVLSEVFTRQKRIHAHAIIVYSTTF